ncbi:hypothetical protein H8A95_21975 [Bradyrhizobium sp. Pear76]|uniref:hypothetical protein n=1 Tax=Bradyrhizobium oropedii TaxID=1571201 RepID=UPI001E5BC6F1|nr:hypothetical protein [Bradyrhizobium oropedii]MCC8964907.1 hypothetical protein [Bradyrhizobium oropedii]
MNMLVSIAATAALPTPAPAMMPRTQQADAELLRLCEEYIVAEQKWCDLESAVDDMRLNRAARRIPSVLNWRQSDAELGLPDLVIGSRQAWHCDPNVDRLRDEKWAVVTRIGEMPDDFTIRYQAMPPSPEARARADEIIAAYDEWKAKERQPRGLAKLERERDAALKAYVAIENVIAATRATTSEGMMAKIRCAKAFAKGRDLYFADGSCAQVMAESIFRDVEQFVVA